MISSPCSVVITGISGLLGSSLAIKFAKQGHKVIGIKRVGSFLSKELNNFEIYEGEITDQLFLEEVFCKADIVIHTAAKVSFDKRDKTEIYKTNVEGSKAVVDACLAVDTKKLIYVSSIAALGRSISSKEIDENTLWEESDFNTNYAVSKYLGELEFWRGIEEGLTGFCVNPSVLLGCGDIEKTSNTIFKNLFRKNIFYTDGSINLIDLRDVVEIIIQLNRKEITGERFILNAQSCTIKDLMHSFTLGRQTWFIKAPMVLVYMAWFVEGIISIFLRKRSNLTLETLKIMNAESKYSNLKIINELGYSFIPLESTLEYCKKYYVEKYKV